MNAALTVDHLSYAFGARQALDDVSFALPAGQFCVLLGPNGAGKTTLFSLITRLYDSPDGDIRVLGHDIRRQSLKALARMGVVFQQPTLDLDLTVMQNLIYHGALHGLSRRESKARGLEELARLDMAERAGERVRALNGGHRRRVEIARALLHRPALLLLDEPTVGLDVPTRKGIVEHVHALARDQGIAVLWATHLIDEAQPDDAVIVLHRGTVRAAGAVPNVIGQSGGDNLGDAFARLTAKAA